MTERHCPWCGETFLAVKRSTKFCSIRCAKKHHYAQRPATEALFPHFTIDMTTWCWNWTGDTRTSVHSGLSYGRTNWHGKAWAAHRLSYLAFTSVEPSPDVMVCHRCDNPLCINPSHLFLGMGDDNHRDMVAKGRNARGERHGMAKLTDKEVEEIRELRRSGMVLAEIAKRYGVHLGTIWQRIRGVRQ